MTEMPGIDPSVPPSGTGCLECDADNGWWLHLRRCTQCGHIGCCDNSPAQHATAHAKETGHPIIRSFEPGESVLVLPGGGLLRRRPGTGPAAAPSGRGGRSRAGRPGPRGLAS